MGIAPLRLLPQTVLPHQGEAPSNAVQNEFPTMPSKRSWGRSTGQRLPPRSETISHDRSHRRAVISRRKRDPLRGGWGWVAERNGARRMPRPVLHSPTLAGVFKKKRRRQSGFRHLRSPKVSKGGACHQAENRSMNTGNRLPPSVSKKTFANGGNKNFS